MFCSGRHALHRVELILLPLAWIVPFANASLPPAHVRQRYVTVTYCVFLIAHETRDSALDCWVELLLCAGRGHRCVMFGVSVRDVIFYVMILQHSVPPVLIVRQLCIGNLYSVRVVRYCFASLSERNSCGGQRPSDHDGTDLELSTSAVLFTGKRSRSSFRVAVECERMVECFVCVGLMRYVRETLHLLFLRSHISETCFSFSIKMGPTCVRV